MPRRWNSLLVRPPESSRHETNDPPNLCPASRYLFIPGRPEPKGQTAAECVGRAHVRSDTYIKLFSAAAVAGIEDESALICGCVDRSQSEGAGYTGRVAQEWWLCADGIPVAE